jgi:acyl-CoA synthetase (AMP-forming)/AMP-acid ligase II
MVAGEYPFENNIDALKQAASTTEDIISYAPAASSESPASRKLSYRELLCTAETNARKLQQLAICKPGTVVLIHFDSALDSIVLYWSVLLAGSISAVTSPAMLNQDELDRQKHLRHLHDTFNVPVCLTRRALLQPFEERDHHGKRIDTRVIGDLNPKEELERPPLASPRVLKPSPTDVVALMLTSGSSGNAQAVPLTHRQLFVAFHGKAKAANLHFPASPFLSWVSMDHVANLVHCHLFAIVSGVSPIQVPAANVLVDPAHLLNLVSRHGVSRTFAPNFLLARLRRQLETGKTNTLDADLNLETLSPVSPALGIRTWGSAEAWSFAATSSSRDTTTTTQLPRPPSPPTVGSGPGTWRISMPAAACISTGAPRR